MVPRSGMGKIAKQAIFTLSWCNMEQFLENGVQFGDNNETVLYLLRYSFSSTSLLGKLL